MRVVMEEEADLVGQGWEEGVRVRSPIVVRSTMIRKGYDARHDGVTTSSHATSSR